MICSLNTRQIEIIEMLIYNNKPIQIEEMATIYDISTRTIRYDLKLIEEWLAENNCHFEKVPKKGLILKVDENQNDLMEKIKSLPMGNRVLSDIERVKYTIAEILTSDKNPTIEFLSNKFFLARNTIIKTLKDTSKYLEQYKLNLEKSSKGGFYIEGSEGELRKVLLEILIEIIDNENLCRLLRVQKISGDVDKNYLNYNNYLDIQRMEDESKILMKIEEDNNYYFTDINFIKLIIYIEIILKRNKKYNQLDNFSETLKETVEQKMSSEIIKYISNNEKLYNENLETTELAKYIIESKSFNTINELKLLDANDIADEETIRITDKFIYIVEQKLNIKIKDDKQLYNGLIFHMKSALPRIRNNNNMKNDYLYEIKENYPFIFQIVKESVEEMQGEFLNTVCDNEIGFIALHIRACYEEIFEKANTLTVLVVCQEGISFLNMLSIKLKKEIQNINIIGTCSIYDYEKYSGDIDFIISTKLFKLRDVDVVLVSPFLSNNDIFNINEKIIQLNKFKLIYKYSTDTTERGYLMLKDILEKDSIITNVNATNWEEAIKIAGNILVEQGKIKENYVENMIKSVKDLGPYIVIMPGIAFAHARPDESVIKTSISLITLSEPVEFGSKANDPVEIVFVFAAEDGGKHIMALQDLAKVLSIDKNVQAILHAKDRDSIYQILMSE